MPRGKQKNYQIDLLISIIEQKLPNGKLAWEEVAALYKVQSQDTELRDPDNIKRYWHEILCNKFQKPTGRAGDSKDRILRCQKIERKILRKSQSKSFGIESSSSDTEESGVGDDNDDNSDEDKEGNENDSESGLHLIDVQSVPDTQVPSLDFIHPDDVVAPNEVMIPESQATPMRPMDLFATTFPFSSVLPAVTRTVEKEKQKSSSKTKAIPSEKTKNSTNRQRGSIVKSIEKIGELLTEKQSPVKLDQMSMFMMNMMIQQQQQAMAFMNQQQQMMVQQQQESRLWMTHMMSSKKKRKRLDSNSSDTPSLTSTTGPVG